MKKYTWNNRKASYQKEKKIKCGDSFDPFMDSNKQDKFGIGPLHTQ